MPRIKVNFLVFLLLFPIWCFSQAPSGIIRCGHEEQDSLHRSQHKDYISLQKDFEAKLQKAIAKKKASKTLMANEIITIPVVVHVVHDNITGNIGGPGNSNISYDQIASQIDVLNADFRRLNADTVNTPLTFKPIADDAGIEFCLATRDPSGNPTDGVTRTYTNQAPFVIADDAVIAGIISWPSDEYLNIWVTQLSGGLLGFAQFPDDTGLPGLSATNGTAATDGVYMHHQYFGNRIGTAVGPSPYTYGRTCTHEVGHWLGLKHIWGSSGCGGTDHVDDTPSAFDENYGCPTGQTSCSSTDMVENYMDYTNDQCMNIFTKDQVTRMRTVFDVSPRRIAIKSSSGCCGTGLTYFLPFQEGFENDDYIQTLGWTTTNTDSDTTWTQHSFGAYNTSLGSIGIESNDSTNGNADYLTSPIISYNLSERATMEFDLAYCGDGGSLTDSLVISYESYCEGTWTTLTTLTGNDLISTANLSNPFSPTADDWKNVTVDMSALANLPVVLIRFEFYSKGVNNLFLDNINIYKESNDPIVTIYPNPSLGETKVDVSFEGVQNVKIEMFTVLGQLLFSDEKLSTNSRLFTFDSQGYRAGMYLLRITTDEGKVVKRLVVLEH